MILLKRIEAKKKKNSLKKQICLGLGIFPGEQDL